MLPDRGREPGRHLDREHHRGLRDRDPARCRRLVHIPAGLPRRAPEPAGQHPDRLGRRHTPLSQFRGRVDALSMLAAARAATDNHAINILPDMSLVAGDTPGAFQPPVAQRDIKAEVIYCVGGVLSPLLCNVYLHRLDRAWPAAEHGVLVRYADDAIVMCATREQAEAALERLTALLAGLGLEPKAAKTRIVHLAEGEEGFDFLGFHHRLVRGWTPKSAHLTFLARWPSRKAIQHARDRIREITGRSRLLLWPELIVEDLNRFLRGWAGYFRYGNSARVLGQIRNYALVRLASWLSKKGNRRRAWGWGIKQVLLSPDHMGLISLDGTVRPPRPFRDWRGNTEHRR